MGFPSRGGSEGVHTSKLKYCNSYSHLKPSLQVDGPKLQLQTHPYHPPKQPSNMSTAAIPVASFGNNPKVAQAIREKLLPEYDVVHTTYTLPISLSELPFLCTPSSSSSNASDKVPKAIIFGGGVSPSDAEQVKEAVLAKNSEVKFVRLTREDMISAGAAATEGEGPDLEVVGRLLKERLGEVLA